MEDTGHAHTLAYDMLTPLIYDIEVWCRVRMDGLRSWLRSSAVFGKSSNQRNPEPNIPSVKHLTNKTSTLKSCERSALELRHPLYKSGVLGSLDVIVIRVIRSPTVEPEPLTSTLRSGL